MSALLILFGVVLAGITLLSVLFSSGAIYSKHQTEKQALVKEKDLQAALALTMQEREQYKALYIEAARVANENFARYESVALMPGLSVGESGIRNGG